MISEDAAQAELARRLLDFRARLAGRESDVIRAAALGIPVAPELAASLPEAHAGLRSVADGWLLWVTEQRGAETQPGAGARIHLTEDGGAVVARRWPSWTVDRIVERINAAAPTDRFPAVTVAVLEDAGWFPGRAVPDDDLTAWVEERTPLDDVRLHPTAHDALREFGGLRLHADGVCDVEFFPHPIPDDRWRAAASLAHWGEAPLYPVAEDRQKRVEALIVLFEERDGTTAVVLAGETDQYAAGSSVDEMIVNYTTGTPLQPVD